MNKKDSKGTYKFWKFYKWKFRIGFKMFLRFYINGFICCKINVLLQIDWYVCKNKLWKYCIRANTCDETKWQYKTFV